MGTFSRSKGLRFERKVARALRRAGIRAFRVLEYDGYSHGWDVALGTPEQSAPCVIQCKATKTPASLSQGLADAILWNPGQSVYFSLHSINRQLLGLRVEREPDGTLSKPVRFVGLGPVVDFITEKYPWTLDTTKERYTYAEDKPTERDSSQAQEGLEQRPLPSEPRSNPAENGGLQGHTSTPEVGSMQELPLPLEAPRD